jgi:hypothetical protein
MTKRLVAVTGEYLSKQDNQQKAEYTEIGVIITGKNGKEYALLDPAINLAGVLMKQNILAAKRNEPPSDRIMLSIFEQQAQGAPQQQQPQQGFQPQYQQQQPQYQQPTGFQQQPNPAYQGR